MEIVPVTLGDKELGLVPSWQASPDSRGHTLVQIGQRLNIGASQGEQAWKGRVGGMLKGLNDRMVGMDGLVESQEL